MDTIPITQEGYDKLLKDYEDAVSAPEEEKKRTVESTGPYEIHPRIHVSA